MITVARVGTVEGLRGVLDTEWIRVSSILHVGWESLIPCLNHVPWKAFGVVVTIGIVLRVQRIVYRGVQARDDGAGPAVAYFLNRLDSVKVGGEPGKRQWLG